MAGEQTSREILVADNALDSVGVPIFSGQEAFAAVIVNIFCQASPDPPRNAHHRFCLGCVGSESDAFEQVDQDVE